MLLFLEVSRHIFRNPLRTALTACIAALLVCGMAFYLGNIQASQEALDNLNAQMPVQVRITNSDASSFTNLHIIEDDYYALASQDVRDVLCTSAFTFRFKPIGDGSASSSMRTHAANAINALEGPATESFTYLEGWDESFLQTDKPVCAVERSFAEENHLELGGSFEAEILPMNGTRLNDTDVMKITVVALYEDKSTEYGDNGWNATAPINWLRGLSNFFIYDSASAYLVNPEEMNVFKENMREHGFKQRSSLSDSLMDHDNTLSVDDEMYIKTSSGMRENLELYNTFLVPFFGLIILIVALITFLTLRSCRKNIAIASSLGRQKLLNAAVPFIGTLIIQMLGCVLASLVMAFSESFTSAFASMIIVSYMLCAIGGTVLAVTFLFRFDTMTLLTKAD